MAAPFFVFRALVLASPVWYPTLDDSIRQKLLNFIWRPGRRALRPAPGQHLLWNVKMKPSPFGLLDCRLPESPRSRAR